MRRSFATLSWVAIAALIAATPSSIAQVGPGSPSSGPAALPSNAAQETGGNLATVAARTPALGQAAKAGSQPVTIASDQGALAIAPGACTITQTIVTGTGGVLLAANATRKSLRYMNIGAADITVSPTGTNPTVGQGMIYAATAAGRQGASDTFNDPAIATNAFSFSASASATVVVWECN